MMWQSQAGGGGKRASECEPYPYQGHRWVQAEEQRGVDDRPQPRRRAMPLSCLGSIQILIQGFFLGHRVQLAACLALDLADTLAGEPQFATDLRQALGLTVKAKSCP